MQTPSLWSDLKDVGKKGSMLASIVALPVLSINAIINKLFEPYLELGQVIVLTAPLLASATIIAMMFMRSKDGGGAYFLYVLAAIIFPFIVADIFGLVDSRAVTPRWSNGWQDYLPWAPFQAYAVGVMEYYFSAYGLQRTISGILCGGFLAWVLQKKIFPRVRTVKEAETPPES